MPTFLTVSYGPTAQPGAFAVAHGLGRRAYGLILQPQTVGKPWFAANPFTSGFSLKFDGTDDHVEVTNFGSKLDTSAPWTMGCWVKPDEQGGYYSSPIVLDIPKDSSSGWATWVASVMTAVGSVDEHKMRGSCLDAAGVTRYTGSIGYTVGLWAHWTLVWDGTNLTLYKNGQAGTPYAVPAGLWKANDNSWFRVSMLQGGHAEWFAGGIDDVRVYARVLSPSEIALLAAGSEPSATDLVGHWPFEEGTGISTADVSGNGNAGTLYGGPTWEQDDPYPLKLIAPDSGIAGEIIAW